MIHKKYTKDKILKAIYLLSNLTQYTCIAREKDESIGATAMLSQAGILKANQWGSMSESVESLKSQSKYFTSKHVQEIINNI